MLVIAAGLPVHNGVAMDIIEPVGELKRGCLCASISVEAGAIFFLVRVNIVKIIGATTSINLPWSTENHGYSTEPGS